MSTAMRTPRTASSGPVAVAKMFSIADIVTKGKPLPNRWVFYAAPGFGKTSVLAYAPSPVFLMTKGETGLETLISSGQLPEVPRFPEAQTWAELLAAVTFLLTGEHGFKTLVLDTANGAEAMLHQYVCERDFGGDMSERGFLSYNKGYEVSLPDWKMFLNDLDKLRTERGITIFFLMHSRVKTFANPSGANYDRYAPEMHEKTWTITKGWADNILFGNFEVVVKQGTKIVDASKKGKAAETSPRLIYTNSDNPTFDAKNRLGLPPEIEMGDGAQEAWKNLTDAVRLSRVVPASPEKGQVA